MIGFTRKDLDNLNQAYWWLAELGEEYTEMAESLRDIYYSCEKILDVEAGIEQGYLDNTGQLVVKNENREVQ